ncbi:MAG: repeat-containing protein, partial [Frankiales bacterium]|nr:repeat-containing protein [Frankiales bacterium]
VVNDGTTTVTEVLSPSGRVLRRVVTTNATSAVVEDISYGYSSGGDSPAYSRPTSGGTITTYLMGLSGLTDVGGTGTWSIYDAHGDVQGTTNAAGTFTAVPTADEFGVGTTPASRLGWLGKQQRPSVGGALGLVRMGVRLYDPKLGRFLQVDPVEQGSCNDYDYVCGDPINFMDLTGRDMSFDEFYGRLASVAEYFGNNWVDQVHDNAGKIAVYLVVTINKQVGEKQIDHRTGHNKVADMIALIQRRTAPPRQRPSVGDLARAAGPVVGHVAHECVVGVIGASPLVEGSGAAATPAGAVAAATGACVVNILQDWL